MLEKKDQETQQHVWPPEAITCYMPTYFVLKEQEAGRDIYTLVRVASGKAGFVIRTNKYADLLETVIQDATIPVFSVTPRQLIEGSLGEPRWKYGRGDGEYKYDFAKRPDYFLKPDFEERKEYEPLPEEPKWKREVARPRSHASQRLAPCSTTTARYTSAESTRTATRPPGRGAAAPEVPLSQLQGRQTARRGSTVHRRAAARPEQDGADTYA